MMKNCGDVVFFAPKCVWMDASVPFKHRFDGTYFTTLDALVINGWVFNPDPQKPGVVCSTTCKPEIGVHVEWWDMGRGGGIGGGIGARGGAGAREGEYHMFVVDLPCMDARTHGYVGITCESIHDVLRVCCSDKVSLMASIKRLFENRRNNSAYIWTPTIAPT